MEATWARLSPWPSLGVPEVPRESHSARTHRVPGEMRGHKHAARAAGTPWEQEHVPGHCRGHSANQGLWGIVRSSPKCHTQGSSPDNMVCRCPGSPKQGPAGRRSKLLAHWAATPLCPQGWWPLGGVGSLAWKITLKGQFHPSTHQRLQVGGQAHSRTGKGHPPLHVLSGKGQSFPGRALVRAGGRQAGHTEARA